MPVKGSTQPQNEMGVWLTSASPDTFPPTIFLPCSNILPIALLPPPTDRRAHAPLQIAVVAEQLALARHVVGHLGRVGGHRPEAPPLHEAPVGVRRYRAEVARHLRATRLDNLRVAHPIGQRLDRRGGCYPELHAVLELLAVQQPRALLDLGNRAVRTTNDHPGHL